MPIIWSDNAPYPEICETCSHGCQCDSPKGLSSEQIFAGETPDECDYCNWGCSCGAEEWEEPGDGGYEEQPDCECQCECCSCECECEEYVIDANSYNQWVQSSCYACDPECLNAIPLAKGDNLYCTQKVGAGYKFQVRVMPTTIKQRAFGFFGPEIKVPASLAIYLGLKKVRCSFTGPVMVPMLLGPTNSEKNFWMSLTPMEVFSLRPGIEKAEGRVLIAGLGMGWMTQKILEKLDVTHVTQVELSPEVIQFFGRPLDAIFPGKIDFIQGDVWKLLPHLDLNSFDSIIFDIWPAYGSAYLDQKFQLPKKEHRVKVWGWGDH